MALVDLPTELLLSIIDLLPPEAFINFALANYSLLHLHGLAPALSAPRVRYITKLAPLDTALPLLRMPAEITLYIMGNLNPSDTMRFVVANYSDLARQGIAPALTPETVRWLRAMGGGKEAGVWEGRLRKRKKAMGSNSDASYMEET